MILIAVVLKSMTYWLVFVADRLKSITERQVLVAGGLKSIEVRLIVVAVAMSDSCMSSFGGPALPCWHYLVHKLFSITFSHGCQKGLIALCWCRCSFTLEHSLAVSLCAVSLTLVTGGGRSPSDSLQWKPGLQDGPAVVSDPFLVSARDCIVNTLSGTHSKSRPNKWNAKVVYT